MKLLIYKMSNATVVCFAMVVFLCTVNRIHGNLDTDFQESSKAMNRTGPSEELKRQLIQLRMNDKTVTHNMTLSPDARFIFLFDVFKNVFSAIKNIVAQARQEQLANEIKAELKEIKEMLHEINDKLDDLSNQMDSVLRAINQNHDVTRIAAIFGGDVLRLKFFMRLLSNPIIYDENNQIKIMPYTQSWAKSVLAMSYDGIDQILFNFHCMITGCITKPIIDVTMDGMLISGRYDIWARLDDVIETLIELQKVGYTAWAIALDIEERSEEKLLFVQPALEERLNVQNAILDIDDRIKTWPAGTYGFVRAASGCPSGSWGTGSYFHDAEDKNNDNAGSHDYKKYILAYVDHNVKWYFCIRHRSYGTIKWPAGRYCIFKYGSCPPNFSQGYIYFDDEDRNNDNTKSGYVPSGIYNTNTRYYFCCRNDGSTSTPIVLPINRPFVLFPLHGNGCQRVHKMKTTSVSLYWDCEDNNNDNFRYFPYPKETNQGINMKIYMCHYEVNVLTLRK